MFLPHKIKWANSVVGIATGYGLDGLGIESQWGRDFAHLSRPALGPTQPPVQWVPGLSRGWRAAGVWRWPPHPLLELWSRKGRAIPLLPLWVKRPVQSLSTRTRVHFTFTLHKINFETRLASFSNLRKYTETVSQKECQDMKKGHPTKQECHRQQYWMANTCQILAVLSCVIHCAWVRQHSATVHHSSTSCASYLFPDQRI